MGVISLKARAEADDGSVGVSTPSSGVSMGTFEAKFLLDGDERYKDLGLRCHTRNEMSSDRRLEMKVHRAIPETVRTTTLSYVEGELLTSETHYSMRVEQRYSQRTWSSAIWVRA